MTLDMTLDTAAEAASKTASDTAAEAASETASDTAAEAASETASDTASEIAVGAVSDVTCEEMRFESADGKSCVRALIWLDAAQPEPRGIVQIAHGMTEHIGRYDAFARFLVSRGFAVCGHDHIGHGLSVADRADLGCLPPKDGKRIMIEDVHTLRTTVAQRYPDAPYFVFGHSMGSFIIRAYLGRYGDGLGGAVICGTGNQPVALSRAGNALARALCAIRGERSTSGLLHNMVIGAYQKAIPDARTPHDWLSTDPSVPQSYEVDPLCGYAFSVGGYATLTDLTAEVAQRACFSHVPKGMPLLYIAGAQDPVGDCGKGVRAAAHLAEEAGCLDVTTVIYDGMRHEILNEVAKEQVFADIAVWMEGRLR